MMPCSAAVLCDSDDEGDSEDEDDSDDQGDSDDEDEDEWKRNRTQRRAQRQLLRPK